MGMFGGGGGSSAADESNKLMQQQIAQQKQENTRKLHELYGNELVALKSEGGARYVEPDSATGKAIQ